MRSLGASLCTSHVILRSAKNAITRDNGFINFILFFYVSGTTGGIMLLAFFVDLIVWFKAGSINFADEQTPAPEELSPINEKPEKSETSV